MSACESPSWRLKELNGTSPVHDVHVGLVRLSDPCGKRKAVKRVEAAKTYCNNPIKVHSLIPIPIPYLYLYN